ncbi:MAG: glycerophosphodiester phosphodiesterase [Bdellovibrionota bacterium]
MVFKSIITVLLSFPLVGFTKTSPLIIGHRGAPGYRPEHTIASYQLAIDQGADFIEPDLVMTKDKVLIARHENEISGTTDVATKFPDRKVTKKIDGKDVTGWFTEDFTLAEIKTLRAKERLDSRGHDHDFKYEIPTFQEVMKLAKSESKNKKRQIGIYPEMKHPTYFQSIGLDLEPALIRALKEENLNASISKVFIQSFELGALMKIRKLTKLPLVFLLDDPTVTPFDFKVNNDTRTYADLMTEKSLKELSKTISGIGPSKKWILPMDKDGKPQEATNFIKLAHAAKLKVHPYTFRSDKEFLPAGYAGDAQAEYLQFFRLGVDGLFSDFPDQAVKAREAYLKEK